MGADCQVSTAAEELDRISDRLGVSVALMVGEGLLPPCLGLPQSGDAFPDGFGKQVIGQGGLDLGVDGIAGDQTLLPRAPLGLIADEVGVSLGLQTGTSG